MEENARLALGGSIDLVEQIVTGKVNIFLSVAAEDCAV